ncbi:contact-dependent growth inhibition system immunity protein [Streptomyces sp. NPDC050507]|uniref:contact-dependent growth inhibition system immunity protein n=1 Tax=Streptomyces sp. NPDC050507 TaxID=3365619 RepID=UPI0037B50919
MTVEDLRLLIGQDVGLPVLLVLAVEVLRDNPLAEGDMYEGDLLRAVLTRSPAVWNAYPDLARRLTLMVGGLSGLSPDLLSMVEQFVGSVQSS